MLWQKFNRDEPKTKDWIGAAIAAGAAVLGMVNSNRQQKKATRAQEENAEKYNQMALLEEYSGGQYSDYLKNYAFRSPSEQGSFERQKMESAYPELNPWELAGTSGVGGAIGSDAIQAASNTAASEAQTRQTAQANETQVAMKAMDNKTQLMTSALGAYTSMANTKAQMEPQMQKLPKELIGLDFANAKSGSEAALLADKANTLISQGLQEQGLQLDVEQKRQLVNKIKQDIETGKYAKSSLGKATNDAANLLRDAALSVVTPENKEKVMQYFGQATETSSNVLDSALSTIKGFLGVSDSDNSSNGVQGVTSKHKKNMSRTYKANHFQDDSDYVKSLRP